MADEPDSTVTIRNRTTGEEQDVFRNAVPFFPQWDVLTKDGRVNPRPAAASTVKDN